MTSLAKIRKCVYPFPVYEAHFADNTVLRMSVWQAAGKPWDFARCRKLLETSHSGGSKVGPWPAGVLIVDGYLEQDVPNKPWLRLRDPLFSGEEAAKRTRKPQAKVVLRQVLAYIDGEHSDAAVIEQARQLLAA